MGHGCERSALRGELLARRFVIRNVWRQFQLERTYLYVLHRSLRLILSFP